MASKTWVLVEWIEENGPLFPSYAIVNYDSLVRRDTELQPGNDVLVLNITNTATRRARIVQISECKVCLALQLEANERREQPYKKMLAICMETIKELKAQKTIRPPRVVRRIYSDVPSEPGVGTSTQTHTSEQCKCQDSNKLPNFDNDEQQRELKQCLQQQLQQLLHNEHEFDSDLVNSRPQGTSTPAPNMQPKEYRDQSCQVDDLEIAEIIKLLSKLKRKIKYILNIIINACNGNGINLEDNNITWRTQSSSELSESDSELELRPQYNHEPTERLCDLPDNMPQTSLHLGASCSHNCIKSFRDQACQADELDLELRRELMATANLFETQILYLLKVCDTINAGVSSDIPKTGRKRKRPTSSCNVESSSTEDSDMVVIGNGNTQVPRRVLQNIDWSSTTAAAAAGQILGAVISTNDSANLSSTSTQSPAQIFDAKIIEDIAKLVSTKCNVPKEIVRKTITIKCTDEVNILKSKTHNNNYIAKRQKSNDDGPSTSGTQNSSSRPAESSSKTSKESTDITSGESEESTSDTDSTDSP